MSHQPSHARVAHDAAQAGAIARASTVLLSLHRSTDDWARDAVDALRGLVRAREAAVLIRTNGRHRTYGDARSVRLLERVAAAPALADVARPAAQIALSALVERAACDTTATAMLRERYDMMWRLVPLGGGDALLGVCCCFAMAVSKRTARARASTLEAVWPALEFASRDRLGRRGTDEAQLRLLHDLPLAVAICTHDGSMPYVNPALATLLNADGDGVQLRAAIGRAGATASPAALTWAEDVAMLRTVRHRYRVRTRLLASDEAGTAARRLVLVEPAVAITSTQSAPLGGEPLRQHFRLTGREYEVARLIHLGHSNQAIAMALGISPNTARHYTERVLVKLGIGSRAAIHGVMLDDELTQELHGTQRAHPGRSDDVAAPAADRPGVPRLGWRDAAPAHAPDDDAPELAPPPEAERAVAQ